MSEYFTCKKVFLSIPSTVEPRFNEPLFNEVLDITNAIIFYVPAKVTVKYMEKNLDITNPPFNEQIWPVPSDLVVNTFFYFDQRDRLNDSIFRALSDFQCHN